MSRRVPRGTSGPGLSPRGGRHCGGRAPPPAASLRGAIPFPGRRAALGGVVAGGAGRHVVGPADRLALGVRVDEPAGRGTAGIRALGVARTASGGDRPAHVAAHGLAHARRTQCAAGDGAVRAGAQRALHLHRTVGGGGRCRGLAGPPAAGVRHRGDCWHRYCRLGRGPSSARAGLGGGGRLPPAGAGAAAVARPADPAAAGDDPVGRGLRFSGDPVPDRVGTPRGCRCGSGAVDAGDRLEPGHCRRWRGRRCAAAGARRQPAGMVAVAVAGGDGSVVAGAAEGVGIGGDR
ncbi:hypothetical protein G6F22_015640 [Rhizopus arrhizus]|nr:hypothetical protein G6F22_015640 [Rhizopus arrhizus]